MFFKPEDLYALGQGGGDIVKGLATDIANNVCGLYQSSPASFGVPNPAGNAVSALASGVWDSFCGRLPEPKLPNVPVPGKGQCDNVPYVFKWRCVDPSGNVVIIGAGFGDQDFCLIGPIGGIRLVKIYASDGSWTATEAYAFNRGSCGSGGLPYQERLVLSTSPFETIEYLNLRRLDGLPDNCAESPDYPAPSAPSVNPRTYNHTGNDGATRPINYNINFPGVGISPTINFPDLPNIKIPVNIDATGIEVNIPVGIGAAGKGAGISEEDLEALLDAASKIPGMKEDIEDLMNGGNQSLDAKGEQEGDTEENVPDIAGVYVNVTEFPPGTGRKFGKPQIFNFGRVHFKRGEFYSAEIPLATVRQWCAASPESDGYIVYLNPGVKAEITVVKQEKENGG